MNHPNANDEITLIPFQRLHIYKKMKDLAVQVHAAKIADSELRDQATRASKSAFLNLSEGLPSESTSMRHKFFTSAAGSVCETAAAVELAAAIGAVDVEVATSVQALAARLKQMLRHLR